MRLLRLCFPYLLICLFGLLLPHKAHAQGSVLPLSPAPGAEALGRAGAFAAKADSPLALEYNVAGLAQLGGTQVLLDGQLWVPNDGAPCQDVQRHAQRPCYGGLAAVTTDLGILRRWTLALGFRLPALVTGYGTLSLSGQDPLSVCCIAIPPALLMAPALAVGVQAHRRLALGLSLEDAMALALAPCPPGTGPATGAGCSGAQLGERSLLNPVVQLGLLSNFGALPHTVLLAASVRSAPNLGLKPMLDGSQRVSLPWTVRTGLRYLHRDPHSGRAVADVELDGVAELWMPEDLQTANFYQRSSVGARLGASYHVALPHATLSGRLGFLFDGSLQRPNQPLIAGFGTEVELVDHQRVYTLGGTVGIGVQTTHLEVQLGYGYVNRLVRSTPMDPVFGDAQVGSHMVSLSLLLRLGCMPTGCLR